jgi:hypothetical protein
MKENKPLKEMGTPEEMLVTRVDMDVELTISERQAYRS